jgi:glutamate---cysteine ligase / carboxylate-amine ligase
LTVSRFGIEEEYFVVNRGSGALRCELPDKFMAAAQKRLGDRVMYEILQSQIEVATPPLQSAEEAIQQLRHYRSTLAEVGAELGVGILAAGTHPLGYPEQQRMTKKRRYSRVIHELGMVGLGSPMCGLHVHVEVPQPISRVDIMHRCIPFLPLLLALSTSSPFWAGYDTGLLGYRNAVNDALPRTGFPEMFRSENDYRDYVDALVEADIIQDATYVWWALRPSLKHPTLELRLTDCCTFVSDAVAVASLYRAMVAHLVRNEKINADICPITRALTEENRWRAQRYGTEGTFIDVSTREAKPFKAIFEETVSILSNEIDELELWPQIAHLRTVIKRGTSAHLQLEHYRALLKFGRTSKQAMRDVAKWLRISTEEGERVDESGKSAPATARILTSSQAA